MTFCDPQIRDQPGFQEQPLSPGDLLELWLWFRMILIKKTALQNNQTLHQLPPWHFWWAIFFSVGLYFVCLDTSKAHLSNARGVLRFGKVDFNKAFAAKGRFTESEKDDQHLYDHLVLMIAGTGTATGIFLQ